MTQIPKLRSRGNRFKIKFRNLKDMSRFLKQQKSINCDQSRSQSSIISKSYVYLQQLLRLSADIRIRCSLFLWQCSASQSNQTCHHFTRRRGRNINNKHQNANQDNNNYPRRQRPTTIVRQSTATTSNNDDQCQSTMNNEQWTIHKQQSTKPRTTNGDGHPTMTNTIE